MPAPIFADATIKAVSAAFAEGAKAYAAEREYRIAVFESNNERAIAAIVSIIEIEAAERESWFDLFGPIRDIAARIGGSDDAPEK